jgi:diguanylate cyclase (GGDEF)-like protein
MIYLKKTSLLLLLLPFIMLTSLLIGAYTDFKRNVSDEEHDMIQHLAIIESNINEITNHNYSKMLGVATYVSLHTDFDIEYLNHFVQRAVGSNNSIISNIGVFEDTTAVYLYPYEPNKDMSNINLADIPSQRDDALRVKDFLEVVITPPVELVQGGTGIMTRMPIRLLDGTYWGQLGYMMRYEDVISSLSLNRDKYSYLITQYDDNGDSHIVYDSGFDKDYLSEEVIVELPSGYWRVKIGYNNILELTSPGFYILILSGISLFILSLYILLKFRLYNEKLIYLSNRDELTGLKNRRAIKDTLESFNTAVMLDIDDFKKVNDTYGHYIGDEVLEKLSRRIETVVRQTDVVVRWGGEEFLVLMMSIDEESALVAAKRILNVFKEPLIVNGNEILITASIGVACSFEMPSIEMNRVISDADKAMYVSKNNGKNQIRMYK